MDDLTGLSNREQEVTKLVLEGKSNKQIASALHISENTVEFHLKNIYSKSQVNSRTELILKLRDSVVAEDEKTGENGESLDGNNRFTAVKESVLRVLKELKMENVLNSTAHQESTPMTFFESIGVCFKKYADFNGRASRPEFWWFMLFIVLVSSALVYVSETLSSIFMIAVLLPLLAVGARRLRDSGTSPWWLLFLLVPVGGIVVLGFLWAQPAKDLEPEDALAV